MRTINIHEAKTHLSKLVELAANGESIIIAKSGRPMVKMVPLDQTEQTIKNRLGFMQGEFLIPDDFDQMGSDDIHQLFNGNAF